MKEDQKIEKIKKRAKKIQELKKTKRYQKCMGALKFNKALLSPSIEAYQGRIEIEDLLWAGQIEPRIFEVLPALVIRKPKMFTSLEKLPQDLEQVLKEIRSGKVKSSFHKVSPRRYCEWIDRLSRQRPGEEPASVSQMNIRVSMSDLACLQNLKQKTKMNKTQLIREALRELDRQLF